MGGHPSPFSNAEAFASLLEGLDSPPPFSNAEAVASLLEGLDSQPPFSNAEAFASLLEGLDSPPNFFNHPANPPLVPLVEALTSFLDGAGALLQEAGAFKYTSSLFAHGLKNLSILGCVPD